MAAMLKGQLHKGNTSESLFLSVLNMNLLINIDKSLRYYIQRGFTAKRRVSFSFSEAACIQTQRASLRAKAAAN